jgi:hypothetical protein
VYVQALAFRGQGNILAIVIMVALGGFGFAAHYEMFKDRRSYTTKNEHSREEENHEASYELFDGPDLNPGGRGLGHRLWLQ